MKPKLTDALRAIIGRSDEIVALAENEERNLPEIFSFRQNNITIQACLEAVDAIADSSPEELANCRGLIAETQEHVTAANNALSERVIRNPLMMNAFIAAENWVFSQLPDAGPEFIGLARLVRRFNLIARACLLAGFTDLRQQLARSCGERPIRVQLVKEEKPGAKSRPGKRTPFMDEQLRCFRAYLETHPVTRSFSVIIRARECWRDHRTAWDASSRNRSGYSSYKALASAV